MTFGISGSGDFGSTEAWLKRVTDTNSFASLERFGAEGVAALKAATPFDSGATAEGWYYEVEKTPTSWAIIWGNRNVVDGVPISILIQYGHATGTGGYVPGQDYINPALKPIFDRMVAEGWKVVTS